MAGERKEASVVGSFLAVTLMVVVVATSSMPVARGQDLEKDDASTSCPGDYSKLCGKDPACTAMVETACRDNGESVESIKGMFSALSIVGGDNYDFASTAWPWGHAALLAAVDDHGGCPGNKTVEQFAGEHCVKDLDAACKDPTCTDGAHIECYRTASKFCYIKATTADQDAINANMDCFVSCCEKKKTSEECRKVCILNK
ncbi:hypothetical protein ACQJBY_014453 [Aegilops geniculata]